MNSLVNVLVKNLFNVSALPSSVTASVSLSDSSTRVRMEGLTLTLEFTYCQKALGLVFTSLAILISNLDLKSRVWRLSEFLT